MLRGAVIYLVLFVLMRAAGNRQFAQMTAFDAVLVILIAETTGQALVGEDYSVTAVIVVLTTIVGLDVAISVAKQRIRPLERITDGLPVLLVNDGEIVEHAMRKERVSRDELVSAARNTHGLQTLDQVKYAVLETNGDISIVPR